MKLPMLASFLLAWLSQFAAAAQSPPGWAWAARIGGISSSAHAANEGWAVGYDAAGNVYVLGTFIGTVQLGTTTYNSQGENDLYLVKYSPQGVVQWAQAAGSTGVEQPQALAVDAQGNCVIAGRYGALQGGDLMIGNVRLEGPLMAGAPPTGQNYGGFPFIAAYTGQGALRWARRLSPSYSVDTWGLALDAQGNSYWSGTTASNLTIAGQPYPRLGPSQDAFLVKHDAAGQAEWVRKVGNAQVNTQGGAVFVDQNSYLYWSVGHYEGDIVMGGATVAAPGPGGSPTLIKLTAAGTPRWARRNLVRVDNTSDYAGVSAVSWDAATQSIYYRISTFPNMAGPIRFHGSPAPIALTPGEITVALARCDTSGQVSWAGTLARLTLDQPSGRYGQLGVLHVGTELGGDLLVALSVVGSGTLGAQRWPINTQLGVTQVLRLSPATQRVEWLRAGGVPNGTALYLQNGERVRAARSDAAGNVYVAGDFMGAAQFGAHRVQALSTVRSDAFVAKLDPTVVTSTRPGRGAAAAWQLYPNPAAAEVRVAGLPPGTGLRVLDALGREVRRRRTGAAGQVLNLHGLAPGLYLVQPEAPGYAPLRLLVQP